MDQWKTDTATASEAMCDGTFTLGAANMFSGPTQYFFKGRMDEVIFLGRALTQKEIKNHFDMGNPD